MAEYRDRLGELQAAGLRVAALSTDAPEHSAELKRDLRLPFPLLCDPTREAVTVLGLLNTREFGGIAETATLVIETDRAVRFSSVDETHRRVLPDELLRVLKTGAAPRRRFALPSPRDLARVTRNLLEFAGEQRKKRL